MPLMSLSKLRSSSEDEVCALDNELLEECRSAAVETRGLLRRLREDVLRERKEFGEACGRTMLAYRAEASVASAKSSWAKAKSHRESAEASRRATSRLEELVRSREEAVRMSNEKTKEAERHLADLVQIKLELAMKEFESLSRKNGEPALLDVSATSRELAKQVK